MFYDHKAIDQKWQKYWEENQTYKTEEPRTKNQDAKNLDSRIPDLESKPKYYVLDMFPYPSGAGLHVGHPLGYIASDIYARFKRHQGFNVLHPIGYDSFGLPAEQYAIQTGQHPAVTTETNIKGGTDKSGNQIPGYENQLKKLGLSFDWSREIWTSDPKYYKWTQWIFIELFHSWYNKDANKAEPISSLINYFEKFGTENLNASETEKLNFTAEEWQSASELDRQDILLNYRLAFRAETTVNWCPALGTVLANDEVKDGKSERGGFPVFQKKMMQWSMRISAYSERLLQGLKTLDWPQPLKDSQEYWIGKSVGAQVGFPLTPEGGTSDSNKNSRFGYLTGGNNSVLNLENAKKHRYQPTQGEEILWSQLSGKKLDFKFRRQHLIEDFIVDFACLKSRLVIEVDGGYHTQSEQMISDEERTRELNSLGFEVIRFSNEEVIGNIEEVLRKITHKCEARKDQYLEDQLKDSIQKNDDESAPPSGDGGIGIEVFTTRPDTIFGATFMVLAPEHPLVEKITTAEQKAEVENYIAETSKKTERDRMADVKNVSGAFTGSYAQNPFTGKEIPVYISDYVLMGYGTGAVMAVPAHDERDHRFAKKFGLPIINVIKNEKDTQEESYDSKDSVVENSDFLNGLNFKEATARIIEEIENREIGHGTTNYRQRDAIFSRQRYWGEPVPVYFKDEMPYTLPVSALPLELPEVEKYLPTEDGDPPLGNAKKWYWLPLSPEGESGGNIVSKEEWEASPLGRFGGEIELSTMPGWAGSSWYFLRYMDPQNDEVFVDKNLADYWGQVDLYIGGSEHATGHLLYSRFWNMFLKDRGFIEQEEPFKKLINQGMILGMSAFVFRIDGTNQFVSKNLAKDYSTQKIHIDISLLKGTSDELDLEKFKKWRDEFADAEFILEDGKYIVEREVEKMSKSKYNVVNPDDICEEYGADCLRLYEMFLGPLEQSKPWNTQGLSGVYGFLKKFWNLYFNGDNFEVSDEEPTKAEYKVLHTLIKKELWDLENFSFNTSVSQFMIAVNELQKLKCNKRKILEPLAVLVSPYAPHISEELWERLGHENSIEFEPFPALNESYLQEDEFEYPVSFNGKMRFKLALPADLDAKQIEDAVMKDDRVVQQMGGNSPKKVIIVPKKIINIVI